MNEETKNYELAFLLKSDEDYKEVLKSVKDAQVEVGIEGKMTKIKLAYPIKRENFAYFGYLHLTGSAENIKKLSEALRNNQKILRVILFIRPTVKPLEDVKIGRVRQGREPSSHIKTSESAPHITVSAAPSKAQNLSNEALEKRLEEILK